MPRGSLQTGEEVTFSSNIKSAKAHHPFMCRRDALDRLEQQYGVVVRFIVGHAPREHALLTGSLAAENGTFGGFHRIRYTEGYKSLPLKTLAFVEEAVTRWDPDWVIKAGSGSPAFDCAWLGHFSTLSSGDTESSDTLLGRRRMTTFCYGSTGCSAPWSSGRPRGPSTLGANAWGALSAAPGFKLDIRWPEMPAGRAKASALLSCLQRCMKTGPIIRSPKFRWYEPQHQLFGPATKEYPIHAWGSIYVRE